MPGGRARRGDLSHLLGGPFAPLVPLVSPEVTEPFVEAGSPPAGAGTAGAAGAPSPDAASGGAWVGAVVDLEARAIGGAGASLVASGFGGPEFDPLPPPDDELSIASISCAFFRPLPARPISTAIVCSSATFFPAKASRCFSSIKFSPVRARPAFEPITSVRVLDFQRTGHAAVFSHTT